MGYAFLQPGEWGRYRGLPLKKEMVEAIRAMNPRVIRYNGNMVSVDQPPENKTAYRWKNMIGARDLRIPFNGAFNPFASHGFGIFEMLDLCNAIEVKCVVGIRTDESSQDYLDLVEYANGAINTPWGAARARDGHPEPYRLQYIGYGNEQYPTPDYAAQFKETANAVWARDPSITFVIGDTWAYEKTEAELQRGFEPQGYIGRKIPVAADLIRWAKARGKAGQLWWDLHYNALPIMDEDFYTPTYSWDGVKGAVRFKQEVEKAASDCTLNLALLEENGAHVGMFRALSHARNSHAIARSGAVLAAAVANCLQADKLDLVWGQGKIFHNEAKVWPQPPYYVDQMISRHWASQVLECDYSSHRHINALAKMTADGSALVLTVANFDGVPADATLHLDGFGFSGRRTASVETLAADQLYVENTAESPLAVAPRMEQALLDFRDSSVAWTFAKYSFTLMRFALSIPNNR